VDRILIVDDEESVHFALRRYLERVGFEVDCAEELDEAKARLAAASYALVLADLKLSSGSGVEGFELLEFVRERHPQTRTILLTAYSSDEVEREAKARGAALVLSKPQPLAALAEAIRSSIRAAGG
jgi:CheY-like chemotaxis protein